MKVRQQAVIGMGLLLFLGLAARAAAMGDQFRIPWDVYASGGEQMTSHAYTIVGTAGQAIGDATAGATYGIEAGYWVGTGGVTAASSVFLPLILKP